MTAEQALAFLVFATVAAVTPGPSNMLLTAAGAARGVLAGAKPTGVAIGMGVMMALRVRAGQPGARHPAILLALKWCGSAFLSGWPGRSPAPGTTARPSCAARRLLARRIQWINQKSWLVCASAVGTYLQGGGGAPAVAGVWAAVRWPRCQAALPGWRWASISRVLRTERAARVFNIVMALLVPRCCCSSGERAAWLPNAMPSRRTGAGPRSSAAPTSSVISVEASTFSALTASPRMSWLINSCWPNVGSYGPGSGDRQKGQHQAGRRRQRDELQVAALLRAARHRRDIIYLWPAQSSAAWQVIFASASGRS